MIGNECLSWKTEEVGMSNPLWHNHFLFKVFMGWMTNHGFLRILNKDPTLVISKNWQEITLRTR